MNGLILIDKPKDYTSFDVVAIMRGVTKQKKIGHTGTLDPIATGVLPILIGSATRAQSLIPNHDKEYVAKFKLGITTDTQDITGKILSNKKFNVSKNDLLNVLDLFKGDILQIPPMYSAVKKDGQKLYELARKGIEVERTPRSVKIYDISLTYFDEVEGIGELKVSCSEGTYIRTLCHDIGNKLECGAVMTELRRTFACGFSINECITLDTAKQLGRDNEIIEKVISIDRLFEHYDFTSISEKQSIRFKNGGYLDLERTSVNINLEDKSILRVYDNQMNFLGLGKVSKEYKQLLVYKLF